MDDVDVLSDLSNRNCYRAFNSWRMVAVFFLLLRCQSWILSLVFVHSGPSRGLDNRHISQQHQLGQQRNRCRGREGLACPGLCHIMLFLTVSQDGFYLIWHTVIMHVIKVNQGVGKFIVFPSSPFTWPPQKRFLRRTWISWIELNWVDFR